MFRCPTGKFAPFCVRGGNTERPARVPAKARETQNLLTVNELRIASTRPSKLAMRVRFPSPAPSIQGRKSLRRKGFRLFYVFRRNLRKGNFVPFCCPAGTTRIPAGVPARVIAMRFEPPKVEAVTPFCARRLWVDRGGGKVMIGPDRQAICPEAVAGFQNRPPYATPRPLSSSSSCSPIFGSARAALSLSSMRVWV